MSLKIKPFTPTPPIHRILMLHGHGQSGHCFRCKTQFLQDTIEQAVRGALLQDMIQRNAGAIEFYYPSGLLPANPDNPLGESNTTWAWGYGDYQSDRILGLGQSVQYIASILETHGPFIGVMGFSTGAALAAITASLLESRKTVCDFQFETTHPPLKFAVCFSGFKLENPFYAPIYNPMITTPFLHVIGTLDTMIDSTLSRHLSKFCANASAYYFAGTHYVPRSRRFLEILDSFVRDALSPNEDREDDWEDYDEF